MIHREDVTTSWVDGTYWLETREMIDAEPNVAFRAIHHVMRRLIEAGSAAGTEFAVQIAPDANELSAVGTEIAALVKVMGIFKAAAVVAFDDVEPDRRAHATVSVMGVTQGEVEFIIDPTGDEGTTSITYRHGVQAEEGRDTTVGRIESTLAAGSRQVPEMVEIHNLWSKLALIQAR